MLRKEKLSGCRLLPRETVLPEALLGFKRLHGCQGAFGESCELFCNPEALEIGQYQWLSCLAYFSAGATWDTCYCLFFHVLITDVLVLFPGRLGETFTLSASVFLLFFGQWWEAPHFKQMVLAGYPIQLLVSPGLLQSTHLPTVSWLNVLIPNSCLWR